MEIKIQKGLGGLQKLRGAVVILDIFRASNTIISLLAGGAKKVWLIGDIELARQLKARDPARILMGERHGIAPPDFEAGNSPCRAAKMDLAGQEVVLTTSAGTQAVHRLERAGPVVFGSFANAGALMAYLQKSAAGQVHLLPMGLEAKEPAAEDDLAAEYLLGLLSGRRPKFAGYSDGLLNCDGASRLRRLDQQDDLAWCTSLDISPLVPRVDYSEDHPFAVKV